MTRTPAGRAGRNWLRHRIEVATRATELLDLKLRGLLAARGQRQHVADRAADEWRVAVRDAEDWCLRAALTGGRRGLRLATPPQPGDATLTWAATMGVRFPATARYAAPEYAATGGRIDSGAAVVLARRAYRRAVEAGVQHAAALAAVRALDREIALTRRRLRALDQRLLPRLQVRLRVLTIELAERELAEHVTRRQAGRPS